MLLVIGMMTKIYLTYTIPVCFLLLRTIVRIRVGAKCSYMYLPREVMYRGAVVVVENKAVHKVSDCKRLHTKSRLSQAPCYASDLLID